MQTETQGVHSAALLTLKRRQVYHTGGLATDPRWRDDLTTPVTTHLQAFVLLQISLRKVPNGKALRLALEREGVSQELPTFYAHIKRLERDGLVTSSYVKASGKTGGRETVYSLTPAGKKALKDVRRFYRRLERLAGE